MLRAGGQPQSKPGTLWSHIHHPKLVSITDARFVKQSRYPSAALLLRLDILKNGVPLKCPVQNPNERALVLLRHFLGAKLKHTELMQ